MNCHDCCIVCGGGWDEYNIELSGFACECDPIESYLFNKQRAEYNAEDRERRQLSRAPCGKGGCSLPITHTGPHHGDCHCINGCKAKDCPNL